MPRLPSPLLALVFLCLATGLFAESKRPNIIFFIADDMYPEMFNCLPEGRGKNLTPNLDKLATEGTIMLKQYVVSPVCTPSRYNCLTGNYASRARNPEFLRKTEEEENQTVIQWNSFITKEDKILSHYLKDLGYTTGFVGKNHVIEAQGIRQPKDFQASAKDPAMARLVADNYRRARQAVLDCGFDYAEAIYHNNPNFIGLAELAVQNNDWIAEKGIDFIDQNHDQPFFLYFATTIPHGPTEPPRSWKADPRVTAAGYLDSAPEVWPVRDSLRRRIQMAGLENANNKELVLWLDDSIGALLSALQRHDILDNTIIFFFNDHGQHAKGTLFQGGVHNPSIVWKKGGFPVGNLCQVPVSNVDFAPTILEMVGLPNMDSHFDGNSFKAVLDETSEASRESMYFELGYARAVIKGDYKYYAVRYPEYAENWTLAERKAVLEAYNEQRRFRNMGTYTEDPTMPFGQLELVPGGGGAEQAAYGTNPAYFDPDKLFNLTQDPREQINLANDPRYQEVLVDMKEELKQYIEALPGEFDI